MLDSDRVILLFLPGLHLELFVCLREQQGTPQFVAEIRDGATGVLIQEVSF
jgi:hypothetical protein